MGSIDKIAKQILLFDGVCNLCNGSVNFIIDHNPDDNIRFSPLQSAYAHEQLSGIKVVPDSIVLIEEGQIFTKSEAALRIAKNLNFPFSLLYYFIFIPGFIRDPLYDFIAKNRYRWFGKKNVCRMPTPELKQRFIESPIVS